MGRFGWSDAPGRAPFVQPPMTEQDWRDVEEAMRETDAIVAFVSTHTRVELASRRAAARENPRWTRWWEDEPPPPRKWTPPVGVRRVVAARYGASPGAVVIVVCPRCARSGEIRWDADAPRFVGLHLDHIRPRARGGADAPENLQLLCPACNFRKGARWEG